MYTYEFDYYDGYLILDTDGEYVITVQSEHEAETLLSHLNQAHDICEFLLLNHEEANKP